MRIGELANRTGVPTRMLRYYEEQGLITPLRWRTGTATTTSISWSAC
ncbi:MULTISPECIES: MerR family DNA-binding transcriptional regulator [unclassified Glutamicibacter]|nr:MerR family DNA-binding transcriptional regulator [Arthrobacter sp. JUb115]